MSAGLLESRLLAYAIAVIVVSVGVALLLALFDFIFSKLLTLVV
jgi:preprotein translocase subunit SecE